MSSPGYWVEACRYLARRDAVLATILRKHAGEAMQSRGDGFLTLARSIVGQQISIKAADSVWAKLEHQFGEICADVIYSAGSDVLRNCGLSQQKSRYLRHVAGFALACDWDSLFTMPEDKVRQQLIAIPGVGQWTWDMFAMFYLQLPDILPTGDAGLVNACMKLYNFETREAIVEHAEAWRPYRTVATWFLWRSLDPVAVAY